MNEVLVKVMELAGRVDLETKHTVMVSYYGHIKKIEVRIHENGWVADQYPTHALNCFVDEDYREEEYLEVISTLENYL